jgi:hypothetical protein
MEEDNMKHVLEMSRIELEEEVTTLRAQLSVAREVLTKIAKPEYGEGYHFTNDELIVRKTLAKMEG